MERGLVYSSLIVQQRKKRRNWYKLIPRWLQADSLTKFIPGILYLPEVLFRENRKSPFFRKVNCLSCIAITGHTNRKGILCDQPTFHATSSLNLCTYFKAD